VEGVASTTMNQRKCVFDVAERDSFLAKYDISNPAKPQFVPLQTTGKGPEGVASVPSRNQVIVATEKSSPMELFRRPRQSPE
jgi:uncharacterized protein YjiK